MTFLDKAMICWLVTVITVGCFRYEQEINKRNDAENEFVMIKKVHIAAKRTFINTSQIEFWHS